MTPIGPLATARPRRLLDRVAGVSVVLGLLQAAMPATGLAGRLTPKDAGRDAIALLDPAQLGEALGRGELPVELLVAGSLVTLTVGLALTLLVGTLRRRRRVAQDLDPRPVESSSGGIETRTTLPWPAQDADAYPPAVSPSVPAPAPDEDMPTAIRPAAPSLLLDAPRAEAWAAREATVEVARDRSGRPSDPPGWPPHAALPVPVTAVDSIQSARSLQVDNPSARSVLGTPDAPLMVELHDERADRAGHRAGPYLPFVAVIGTVAVGVAFAAGAAVGAVLGVGAGAGIGLAFAAGAGVAIGATVALLGGRR